MAFQPSIGFVDLRLSTALTNEGYLAEHVGMDRSFISDLENGRKEICLRDLELLAAAFGLTIPNLMSRL